MQTVKTDCCIVGGGPGGLLLSLLLAKQGHQVTVLEKQKEFEMVRGGAIIQPGMLMFFENLGLLELLKRASQDLDGVVEIGRNGTLFERNFATLEGCTVPYALAVPLVVLRQTLLDQIKQYPNIQLHMDSSVLEMQETEQECFEMLATVDGQPRLLEARVVVGADGKNSNVRNLAGIDAVMYEFDNPLLILRISRPSNWGTQIRGYHHPSFFMTVPIYDNALSIFNSVSRQELLVLQQEQDGLTKLLNRMVEPEPALSSIHQEVTSWQQVLAITYHSLDAETWCKKNVVLMGDSAHSMHSLGGQGMNMALQDAVLLAEVIRKFFATGNYGELGDYERLRKPFVKYFQDLQKKLLGHSDEEHRGQRHHSLYQTDFENLALGQVELRGLLMSSTY